MEQTEVPNVKKDDTGRQDPHDRAHGGTARQSTEGAAPVEGLAFPAGKGGRSSSSTPWEAILNPKNKPNVSVVRGTWQPIHHSDGTSAGAVLAETVPPAPAEEPAVEAESRQQQKKRGIVACKRSKEEGTWREPRQPEGRTDGDGLSSTTADLLDDSEKGLARAAVLAQPWWNTPMGLWRPFRQSGFAEWSMRSQGSIPSEWICRCGNDMLWCHRETPPAYETCRPCFDAMRAAGIDNEAWKARVRQEERDQLISEQAAAAETAKTGQS